MKRRTVTEILTLILLFTFAGNLMAQIKYETRDDIPAKYKWNFNDIYKSWDEWQKGYEKLQQKMDEVAALKGTLNSSENLLNVLKLQDNLNMLSYLVYRYPQLMRDTDTRNQDVSSKLQQVQILFSKFGTATAWINPKILQIPWEKTKGWIESNKEFEPFRFSLEDLYRQQKHVLDEEKEKLISYYSQFNGSPREVYTQMSTSDIKFPTVMFSDSSELKMTSGNYSLTLATNKNQNDRKIAFDGHYNVYKDYENTYASIYDAVCKRDWANAQARNYSSSVEAALEGNNIPIAVYENLVNTIRENTGPLQRYTKLRKEILGLEKYETYDGSIPLIDFNKMYDYDEAAKWVMESVAPLGEDYQMKLKKAIDEGWLDVYETDGKRSGAYSANVYGVHPYMLLNFNGTMRSVFTLGHELGHTMHTVLANENQPFSTSSYTIFVAEVASTFNESLLLDYMLEKTNDPKERIALLLQAISNLSGTMFFQTLLADYELQVHKMVEEGKPVTSKVLNSIMKDLFKTYYGDAMEENELLQRVWARIPHLYRTPFYVYQYATCFASSAQIYKTISQSKGEKKKEAIDNYLNLLKSGGNDYPMEQLKKAGVDLTKKETIIAVVNQMDKLVSQLEVEIKNLK